MQENLFLSYGIVTLAVFGGIYLLYYWATTSVFQYAVLKKNFINNIKKQPENSIRYKIYGQAQASFFLLVIETKSKSFYDKMLLTINN